MAARGRNTSGARDLPEGGDSGGGLADDLEHSNYRERQQAMASMSLRERPWISV
jgi:hypothetical protein